MTELLELLIQALRELVARESYCLRQKAESIKKKKIVLFPAGSTAQIFYHRLRDGYDLEAEFFIDNNPALHGASVCGKPIYSLQAALFRA